MSGPDTLTINPTVVAAVAAVGVGFAAIWSNPQRTINRAFFSASLHVAAWLGLLFLATTIQEGLIWLRTASAVGAFLPLQLWLIKDSIVASGESLSAICWRRRWWLVAMAALAALAFTDWFIPAHSSQDPHGPKIYGIGYHGYYVGLVLIYGWLCWETIDAMRSQIGVRRLELQLVLLGGCASAVMVLLLMGARALLDLPWLIRLQPLVILIFYVGMVVSITRSRIFDARQIVIVVARQFSLIAVVAAAAFFLDSVTSTLLPEPAALLITTGVALWFAAILSGWLDQLVHFYPQATAARQAAFAAAGTKTRSDDLEKEFLSILKGWGQTDHALILSGNKDGVRGPGIELSGDSTVVHAMRQLRWATPERLARERLTPERETAAQFLREHELGVLVVGEGPTLTVFVGVGVAASRRPFTYPQVAQLLELASIIESALERAIFSAKVQHAEQLATVGLLGASLAHEIRNPLVTIKTFVQLLPQHHQDAAFREKFFRLIGDEVGRIDRLTEQLLDLASPRVYVASDVELHPVLRASLDLVAAKAADKNINFRTEFLAAPDRVFTDPSAAKQVMLNLCFNAIQAVESRTGERWVKVSTRNTAGGVEMAVADNGPGISAEIRPRLFQPFSTTKSSGFGLGLAICSDILANLNATISVDPAGAGSGATFRVTFPCQPSSS